MLYAITKKSGNMFRVGTYLDFVWLTTRTMHPHGCTCGGPGEIELTATGMKLNGSQVSGGPLGCGHVAHLRAADPPPGVLLGVVQRVIVGLLTPPAGVLFHNKLVSLHNKLACWSPIEPCYPLHHAKRGKLNPNVAHLARSATCFAAVPPLQSWGMLGGADAGALPVEVLILMRSWRFLRLVNHSLMNKRVGCVQSRCITR